MLLPDVNILIYAHRVDMPSHAAAREWLTAAVRSAEPLTVPDVVAIGFLRIVTNPRAFNVPSRIEDARSVVSAIYASGVFVQAVSGKQVVDRMMDFAPAMTGSSMTDAYIAAVALEMEATLVSADRGFNSFPGLTTLNPIATG